LSFFTKEERIMGKIIMGDIGTVVKIELPKEIKFKFIFCLCEIYGNPRIIRDYQVDNGSIALEVVVPNNEGPNIFYKRVYAVADKLGFTVTSSTLKNIRRNKI
jgi:hypothetical protein